MAKEKQDAVGGGRLCPRCRHLVNTSSVIHSLHYVKTWRQPQNWNYKTYCIAVRGGPKHGHR